MVSSHLITYVPACACRIATIVPNTDLKTLISNLEGKFDENEKWEDVIDKSNNTLSYKARCCKPKVCAYLFFLEIKQYWVHLS